VATSRSAITACHDERWATPRFAAAFQQDAAG